MASTKEYRDYILDNLSLLDNITYKPMMGEYLLYYDGKLFGGIYDDRLLVKKVVGNSKYQMEEAIPYTGAKPMYLVDDIENSELLKDIIVDTCKDL
jgi:TfoX/Sxy family transcriptional regulator of competence genes